MKTEAQAKACTLLEFIDLHFEGNQRAFAAAQGVQPPQVTQWIQKDFIVVSGQLYSPRRELKT
jgi:DNA-binding transcriptional regulator YdaS (Cro superfamily)